MEHPTKNAAIRLLSDQRIWSRKAFGDGKRTQGLIDHMRKELDEVEDSDGSVEEWVDVVIIALDGLWRAGSTNDGATALFDKLEANAEREWPPLSEQSDDKPVEHIREEFVWIAHHLEDCSEQFETREVAEDFARAHRLRHVSKCEVFTKHTAAKSIDVGELAEFIDERLADEWGGDEPLLTAGLTPLVATDRLHAFLATFIDRFDMLAGGHFVAVDTFDVDLPPRDAQGDPEC